MIFVLRTQIEMTSNTHTPTRERRSSLNEIDFGVVVSMSVLLFHIIPDLSRHCLLRNVGIDVYEWPVVA